MERIRELFDEKTIKFLLVGVVNTVVGAGVMFVLYNIFSVSYWIASASNYIVGSIVSYFLNKYYTFKNDEKSLGQIVRFILNISICYLVAYGGAKPLVAFVLAGVNKSVQDNLAMFAGMGFFVVLNYLGQRIFVFKEKEN